MTRNRRDVPTADEPGTAFRVNGKFYIRDIAVTDAERARLARQQESAVLSRMNEAARALWRR